MADARSRQSLDRPRPNPADSDHRDPGLEKALKRRLAIQPSDSAKPEIQFRHIHHAPNLPAATEMSRTDCKEGLEQFCPNQKSLFD